MSLFTEDSHGLFAFQGSEAPSGVEVGRKKGAVRKPFETNARRGPNERAAAKALLAVRIRGANTLTRAKNSFVEPGLHALQRLFAGTEEPALIMEPYSRGLYGPSCLR